MERVVGIEPTFPAWKAGVLPIYDTRIFNFFGAEDGTRTRNIHLGKVALYHWVTSAYLVQMKGVEPPRRKALDPKSSASANSATSAFFLVAHPGIEPGTPWLKVMCSTDWASEPYLFNYVIGWDGRIRTYA